MRRGSEAPPGLAASQLCNLPSLDVRGWWCCPLCAVLSFRPRVRTGCSIPQMGGLAVARGGPIADARFRCIWHGLPNLNPAPARKRGAPHPTKASTIYDTRGRMAGRRRTGALHRRIRKVPRELGEVF